MVYCSHQSAFLHSRSSFQGGVAARAKHLGFWLQNLASISKWIYPNQSVVTSPPFPCPSHTLFTEEAEKVNLERISKSPNGGVLNIRSTDRLPRVHESPEVIWKKLPTHTYTQLYTVLGQPSIVFNGFSEEFIAK